MKTRIYWLAGALLVFCLLGWTGLSQSTKPPQPVTPKPVWEYKVVNSWNNMSEADLNKLGADGWELVQFESGIRHGGNETPRYLFKRAK